MAMNSFAHIWKERSPWRRDICAVWCQIPRWGCVCVYMDAQPHPSCLVEEHRFILISMETLQDARVVPKIQRDKKRGWLCALVRLNSSRINILRLNGQNSWDGPYRLGQGRYLFSVFIFLRSIVTHLFILTSTLTFAQCETQLNHRLLQVMIRLPTPSGYVEHIFLTWAKCAFCRGFKRANEKFCKLFIIAETLLVFLLGWEWDCALECALLIHCQICGEKVLLSTPTKEL